MLTRYMSPVAALATVLSLAAWEALPFDSAIGVGRRGLHGFRSRVTPDEISRSISVNSQK